MRKLIFTIIVAASATAQADHRTYTRKAAVPPAASQAKPAELAKPAAEKPAPANPTFTANQLLEIEETNQSLRAQQADILEQLVRDTPDTDPQKPDIMFQLAEHYAREMRFWRIKQGDADVQRH